MSTFNLKIMPELRQRGWAQALSDNTIFVNQQILKGLHDFEVNEGPALKKTKLAVPMSALASGMAAASSASAAPTNGHGHSRVMLVPMTPPAGPHRVD